MLAVGSGQRFLLGVFATAVRLTVETEGFGEVETAFVAVLFFEIFGEVLNVVFLG